MTCKERVLIVDDITDNLKILSDLLKDEYDVSVATNGQDALKIASSAGKIDIILLDIMMPDMDGYEVLHRLKAAEKTADIPVIFVTAMDSDDDESEGFAAGCVDYITKPVSPPIVRARIKSHLELIHSREKLEQQNIELKKTVELRESVEQIARHDLKNPLTLILSGVDIIADFGKLNTDQLEIIDDMKEGAKTMLDMINTSLDLFKMEQELYRLQPVNVDILDILRRIERESKTLISLNKSRFSITVDGQTIAKDGPIFVLGEPLLIYSMLANLIKNALEAVPDQGEIKIVLSDRQNFIGVNIHNTGTVPKIVQDRFFEKYVTSGKKQGTGLGTYSAKLIAKTLKGTISMASSEENGTDIFIKIPAA